MTASIAAHGDPLAALMRRAGFRYVFLGIENVLEDDLAFLKARAKNSRHERGRRTNTRARSRRHPPPSRHARRRRLDRRQSRRHARVDPREPRVRAPYVDWPYIQHPTPYPGTPMTRDFVERGLIINPRVEEYDGTTAVTRSAHLEPDEIEFLRWKAERWMKVRHMPKAFRHDPGFVLQNGRGCSRTRSGDRPGDQRWDSSPRARCSSAIARSAPASVHTSIGQTRWLR